MSIKIISITLSTLGVVGTGGVFLYKHFTKTTVREELQKEKNTKILDDNATNEDLQKILDSNKGDKESSLKAFIKKYNSPNISPIITIQIQDLKKACEKVLNKESTKNHLDSAKLYCTKTENN